MKHTLKITLLTSLLALTITSFSLNISKVGTIYYFGDSLFDGGYMNKSVNFLPDGRSPVYTSPHGHTTPYYVSRAFNKPIQPNNQEPLSTAPSENWADGTLNGNNYAAGGAVTSGIGIGLAHYKPPALDYQISEFLKTHNPHEHPNDVYVIWIGANDLSRTLLDNKDKNFLEIVAAETKAIHDATETIKNQVARLSQAGAHDIFVLTLPPFGKVPLMNANPLFEKVGNFVTQLFNAQLTSKLLAIKKDGIDVHIFDVTKTLETITHDIDINHSYTEPGTALTLTNDKKPACIDSASNPAQLAINCTHWVPEYEQKQYLFADAMHPTDTAHQILAIQLEHFIESSESAIK